MNSIYLKKILIIIFIILLNNNINNTNNTICNCSVHYINNTYFKSVPTIIKTFENDSVLLPCNTNSKFFFFKIVIRNELLIN